MGSLLINFLIIHIPEKNKNKTKFAKDLTGKNFQYYELWGIEILDVWVFLGGQGWGLNEDGGEK